MKEEIRKVLEHLILNEQLEVILDIVDTLLSLNYETALDEISTIIMIADDYADMSMLVERINDILRTALDYILGTYEVIVADEATAFQRHAVVKALVGIPLYILPDDISKVIEAVYDNEETLAHIVTMFVPIDTDEILEQIVSISQGSFDNIKTTIANKLLTRGVATEHISDTDRVMAINKLITILGKEHLQLITELSNSGVHVGRSMEQLLNMSFEALETRNVEDAAKEIIGLVWFSDTPIDQINQTIVRTFEEYTENNMERSMMMRVLNEYKVAYGS
ncbi:putative structural head protein [Pseudomonas phage Phabio]|uniref:Putative structural head protein n=1 Tax=Pseudomonas phage Phabio TaxID=2006668 RepID=A0A1Y0SW13_9CAUD|nr:putative structural head protein [Pseudomonas phage Phabio]ARV76754.1 putative structural head protein [Pseudomonas phage Phabio]